MTRLFASSATTSRSARRRARPQRPITDFTTPATRRPRRDPAERTRSVEVPVTAPRTVPRPV